jgi:hypothetical protein
MPAESERQRRFMGADLGRLERGEKTQTGMSRTQLRDFARKPKRKLTRRNRR